MNPNPWLLKRDQVASVLQEEPLLDGGSLRRLVSAYDPQGTGLIKYVKLSTAGLHPNQLWQSDRTAEPHRGGTPRKSTSEAGGGQEMGLAASGSRLRKVNAQRRYKHTSTDSHSHIHDPGTEPLPSGKPRDDGTDLSSVGTYTGDYGSEKYLLQLARLYEDCEGTITVESSPITTDCCRLEPWQLWVWHADCRSY